MVDRPLVASALLIVAALAVAVFLATRFLRPRSESDVAGVATFVGASKCAPCHKNEYELWLGSDHQLAMQEASPATVLGNFGDAHFTCYGVTSRFFTREGKFFVETEGPDGKAAEYPVLYTFGVRPLQQYLVPFPGGRYQAFSLAWDTRPRRDGGERWFHLYPDENIRYDDELHWTKPAQNWNYMCAECHSTNLRKTYDLEANRYDTSWSEINVACEACHGPGSRHVSLAKAEAAGKGWPAGGDMGLAVRFKERADVAWIVDPGTGSAKRTKPPGERPEVEACARCHARRSTIWSEYEHGRPFLDMYRPSLLEDGLYYPDGQIRDEVYEYGSFLQSKMYQKGVTCSDCHEVHSGKIRGTGNLVCAGCHTSAVFDSPSHHFHKQGARCVDCHMPTRTYMVVDPRRDHSLRVPRPDLAVKLGVPSACTSCHKDRSARWAASAVARWYGANRRAETHYGEALHAGERGLPGAEKALAELARNAEAPSIVRATALSLLGRYVTQSSVAAIEAGLHDHDALVRFGATEALRDIPTADRLRLAHPVTRDPVRAVRVEAAFAFTSVPSDQMSPDQRADVEKAAAEYRAAQLTNADQAWAHMNIGLLYAQQGKVDQAERAYRTALQIDPRFIPPYANLADLMRATGREAEGEKLLNDAIAIAPGNGDLQYALGLLLVRVKRMPEAIKALERAATRKPEEPHYSYVLAVALQSAGQIGRALAVLERAHQRHPLDRELLNGLVLFNEGAGHKGAAVAYARKLVAIAPDDPEARRELRRLEGAPIR